MYQYIKGILAFSGEDFVVIENNGIGYRIHTSNFSMSDLGQADDRVTLFTQLIVREDDMTLYGFSTKEELKMFQLLTTVSGVGPKVAVGILSSIAFSKLVSIIMNGDVTSLTKAHGVGKKTAQRIILELKEKVDLKSTISVTTLDDIFYGDAEEDDEVVTALITLGYGKAEAQQAVNQVKTQAANVEDMMKKALRILAK
ncbi:MAG: Holliday junction branch migration protein RuvA [Bacillota bacterium]